MKYQRAWAEINLAHLRHNLRAVKRLAGGAEIMGIVKADAYGHGAVPVANTLLSEGVRVLGVATCEEGVALRENGITAPVLVMGYTPEPLLPYIVENNLAQTVFYKRGAENLAKHAAKSNKKAAIHIKIDTGMSRLGFLPCDETISEICEIAQNPNLIIEGMYTHFATSDALDNSFMYEQHKRFAWVLAELKKRGLKIPIKHTSNSGALAQNLRDVRLPMYDIVRLGITLYGHAPSAELAPVCAQLGLKPVMRFMSQVSMVKHLSAGVGISYGHIYKTERPSVIAVLPVGYADGFPRRLSHGGRVLIGGRYAPIAGAICMDQCMADITDIPDVKPGDPVVLMDSADNLSAECLAETVGTISYEILCCIGKRIPRVYV